MADLLRNIGRRCGDAGTSRQLVSLLKRHGTGNVRGDLRFEWLLQQIYDFYDPNLDVLAPYGGCAAPNESHYIIAQLLGAGHIVCTTNFDCLIERACRDLGIAYAPVLSDADFRAWCSNRKISVRSAVKPLFKIHGSLVRLSMNGRVTATRTSIRATIDAIGRQGIEAPYATVPAKRMFVETMLRERDLVVVGYSGGDDFDLARAIETIESQRRIIWIEHAERWQSVRGTHLRQARSASRLLLKRSISSFAGRRARDPAVVDIVCGDAKLLVKRLASTLLPSTSSVRISMGVAPRVTVGIDDMATWAVNHLDQRWKAYHVACELFRYFEVLEAFRRCAQRSWRLGRTDQTGRLVAGYLLAWRHWVDGRYDAGAALCYRLIYAARRVRNASLLHRKALAMLYYLRTEHLSVSSRNEAAHKAGSQAFVFLKKQIALKRSDRFFKKMVGDLLTTLGTLSLSEGKISGGLKQYQQAFAVYKAVGDITGLAYAGGGVGDALRLRGRSADAERYYARSADLSRQIGYRWHVAWCDLGRAEMEIRGGDGRHAERLLRGVVATYRASEDRTGLSMAYRMFGDARRMAGNLPGARRWYLRSLRICRELGDRQGKVAVYLGLGDVDRLRGRNRPARRYFNRAVEISKALGTKLELAHAMTGLATLETSRARSSRGLRAAKAIYARQQCEPGCRMVSLEQKAAEGRARVPLPFVYLG
jgi:tetratricopeptide (TPR) repeat protein